MSKPAVRGALTLYAVIRFGKAQWLAGGTIIVLAASAILMTSGTPNSLAPMPIHQVALAWTIGVGCVLVLPGVFLLTLAFLWDNKHLGKIVLVVCLAAAAFSVAWFVTAWSFGQRYQGSEHTLAVAIENAIGFAFVMALALAGLLKGSKQLQAGAYLSLFVLMSWCAFPTSANFRDGAYKNRFQRTRPTAGC